MRQVYASCAVSDDPIDVIDAIWSGEEWNARWSAIQRFDVQYDDGIHQVAEIMLDWHGTETQMKVVRFRTKPHCIEFFCPRPPQPLAHQSGSWAIETGNGQQNILVASRHIALTRQARESKAELQRRLDNYADRLTQRLSLILSRFASGVR
jgi:hypothetical protein